MDVKHAQIERLKVVNRIMLKFEFIVKHRKQKVFQNINEGGKKPLEHTNKMISAKTNQVELNFLM